VPGIFLGVTGGRKACKADLIAICEPTVQTKCGSLDVSQPHGLPRPVTGIYIYIYFFYLKLKGAMKPYLICYNNNRFAVLTAVTTKSNEIEGNAFPQIPEFSPKCIALHLETILMHNKRVYITTEETFR
jgi:hypothetical protein